MTLLACLSPALLRVGSTSNRHPSSPAYQKGTSASDPATQAGFFHPILSRDSRSPTRMLNIPLEQHPQSLQQQQQQMDPFRSALPFWRQLTGIFFFFFLSPKRECGSKGHNGTKNNDFSIPAAMHEKIMTDIESNLSGPFYWFQNNPEPCTC